MYIDTSVQNSMLLLGCVGQKSKTVIKEIRDTKHGEQVLTDIKAPESILIQKMDKMTCS